MFWAGSLVAAAALVLGLVSPAGRAPSLPLEPEALRALAPTTAAGLGPERSSDPLAALQRNVDRLLDRMADEG